MSDLYSPELTAVSLANFTISPVSFKHSQVCEEFESQHFKKIKFLCSYFVFVTYLPREVDGRVISEIYFCYINIEYEVLRESRSYKFFHSPSTRMDTIPSYKR